jgi:hypothetical protein
MRYRSRVLNREKFFLVENPGIVFVALLYYFMYVGCGWEYSILIGGVTHEDGVPDQLRLYRYPGFQYESMKQYQNFDAVPGMVDLIQNLRKLTFAFDGVSSQQQSKAVVINHVIGTRYLGVRKC